jgi:agmatine deiminase
MVTTGTADAAGYALPAEWCPHRATWLAWPSHGELWADGLEPARREFEGLCRAIAGEETRRGDAGDRPRETLEMLVLDEAGEREAAARLAGLPIVFHRMPFGDIWLRDTGPVFLRDARGDLAAARFRFNGWGGKYVLPSDDSVAERIANVVGCRQFAASFVLEGGAVEVDGQGTCLTTRQCLLNRNRNPGATAGEMEHRLIGALGVRKVVWLEEGLAGDHTDGHVDNVARFAAPGVVLCMLPSDPSDPNRTVLERTADALARATDAEGRRFEVVTLPSPGRVVDDDGRPVPASYMNFYVCNAAVVVPVYGSKYDARAVDVIAACFPGRRTVGLPARAILTGGGAFHCITQPEPRADVPD